MRKLNESVANVLAQNLMNAAKTAGANAAQAPATSAREELQAALTYACSRVEQLETTIAKIEADVRNFLGGTAIARRILETIRGIK
jgi:chromosome condensin MukBEF ATPase and DNA-binding subunit MukB